MAKYLVTPLSNVEHDEVSGDFRLKNPAWVGWQGEIFPLTIQGINPETGEAQLGTVFKVAVYWEHARNPSPSFEDPEALFWLETDDGEEEDDYDDEDDGSVIETEARDV